MTDMEVDEPAEPGPDNRRAKGKGVVSGFGSEKTAPWVEKYRPATLAEVSAHKDIIDTIDRLTTENKLPHLLLYGPPGTGKTSTILAVAKKMYGPHYQNMILELNASDDRGIDVVRREVQDFASTQSISFGTSTSVKLVVLDEADAMTKDAQFALRRIIEKYTRRTRFCLICNYVNKIIPALQSRCTRFRFPPLAPADVQARLKFITDQERLNITDSAIAAVTRLSNGDMRKALNILQSVHMSVENVTEDDVYLCTGNPMPRDIEQIAFWLLNEPFSDAYQKIQEVKTHKGLALVDIIKDLQLYVFRIDMPATVRVELMEALADTEYRLSSGTGEKMQLGSVIAAFTHARIALVAAAK